MTHPTRILCGVDRDPHCLRCSAPCLEIRLCAPAGFRTASEMKLYFLSNFWVVTEVHFKISWASCTTFSCLFLHPFIYHSISASEVHKLEKIFSFLWLLRKHSLEHLVVTGKVEGRGARGRQSLKFLDSLSTCWEDKVSPTPVDHQSCRGQIAVASNGRQRRPRWHGTITTCLLQVYVCFICS